MLGGDADEKPYADFHVWDFLNGVAHFYLCI